MAKEILEQNVRRKVEAFLVSQGQTVEDLTEGQLTELYWNILSESIDEAEEKRVTQYDFSKEGDIEEFNRDKDNVDGEDITVGDDGAQISEDEIDEMVRENQHAVMSKSE
jgi:hypothetical protein